MWGRRRSFALFCPALGPVSPTGAAAGFSPGWRKRPWAVVRIQALAHDMIISSSKVVHTAMYSIVVSYTVSITLPIWFVWSLQNREVDSWLMMHLPFFFLSRLLLGDGSLLHIHRFHRRGRPTGIWKEQMSHIYVRNFCRIRTVW